MTPNTHEVSARADSGPRPIAVGRLVWLEQELSLWVADGLLLESNAEAIRARYTSGTRSSLLRVVVGLGTAFLAVGLLWLVATNLDELPPLARMAIVAAIWVGFVVLAQMLQSRGTAECSSLLADEAAGQLRAPSLASVCHLLAAAAFGAVIFQAAQSLQVPAFEPRLVGLWSLGAVLYAYVTRSHGALGVGLIAATIWVGWFTGQLAQSSTTAALMVLACAVVATAVAVMHEHLPGIGVRFAAHWRFLGAGLALTGVFIAAWPFGWAQQDDLPGEFTALLLAAICASLVGGAVVLPAQVGPSGTRNTHLAELGTVWLVFLAGTALAWWRPQHSDLLYEVASLSPQMWARTTAGLMLFVAAAAWYAVLGTWRESGEVSALALFALVIFTTAQSFAIFAPIASGATLFLSVGTVMVLTGLTAERVGRRLLRDRPRSARPRASASAGEAARTPLADTPDEGQAS
ncbi:DUF2157 domain-containing protein [Gephyromycinifex aptenodytis]|uniref:DUF2157 domain-containing protein n=1 Tax=Gephyromycinifex aptenodytis TaxID=2716227 RepID=UPI001446F12F|nr:DUF2157 domain-containing protein [Gephyromycinifex aptenodytis]